MMTQLLLEEEEEAGAKLKGSGQAKKAKQNSKGKKK